MSLQGAEAGPSTVCLCSHTHTRQTGSRETLLQGSRLLIGGKRDPAREGKRADTIGLGKIEAQPPKNAVAGSAGVSAGTSGDCIATGEKKSRFRNDRAANGNDESQDKRILDRPGPTVSHSAGGGQGVGRSKTPID